ncbi:MAG: hypothetical protein ACOH1T_03755 [Microbacteriaceae bacterium]
MTSWTPEKTFAEYTDKYEIYKAAAAGAEGTLITCLTEAGFGPVTISAREKQPLELFKKQRLKGYANPWTDCPDLVGARIIVSDTIQKSEVLATLVSDARVSVLEIEDQAATADPSRLEYRGLHVHVNFPGLVNSGEVAIRVEIQIRTTAEHAWAETVHKYHYKAKSAATAEISRTFNRLLVLVELFDQELSKGIEMVTGTESFEVLEFSRYLERQLQLFAPGPTDIEMTAEHIRGLMRSGFGDVKTLRTATDRYIQDHKSAATRVFSMHGQHSPSFDVARDWMFTQGESLLFLALLDIDLYALSSALESTDLYPRIEEIALGSGLTGFNRQ